MHTHLTLKHERWNLIVFRFGAACMLKEKKHAERVCFASVWYMFSFINFSSLMLFCVVAVFSLSVLLACLPKTPERRDGCGFVVRTLFFLFNCVTFHEWNFAWCALRCEHISTYVELNERMIISHASFRYYGESCSSNVSMNAQKDEHSHCIAFQWNRLAALPCSTVLINELVEKRQH